MGVPSIELPMLDLQLHKVYELTPGTTYCILSSFIQLYLLLGPFGCNCTIVDPSEVVAAAHRNGQV